VLAAFLRHDVLLVRAHAMVAGLLTAYYAERAGECGDDR
jgi:hypothetical protein